MINLDEIEARAQRQLDGMTVNRDAIARDNLKMVALLRQIKKRLQEQDETSKTSASSHGGDPREKTSGSQFASAFDDLFGNAGWRK